VREYAAEERRIAMSEQPMYRAYTVVEREGDAPFWLNIGVAFAHKDSKGLNVIHRALPFDGKLVLRAYEDELQNSRGGHRS
jgi:hypothetical protein